jgi:hypothetical protein
LGCGAGNASQSHPNPNTRCGANAGKSARALQAKSGSGSSRASELPIGGTAKTQTVIFLKKEGRDRVVGRSIPYSVHPNLNYTLCSIVAYEN